MIKQYQNQTVDSVDSLEIPDITSRSKDSQKNTASLEETKENDQFL